MALEVISGCRSFLVFEMLWNAFSLFFSPFFFLEVDQECQESNDQMIFCIMHLSEYRISDSNGLVNTSTLSKAISVSFFLFSIYYVTNQLPYIFCVFTFSLIKSITITITIPTIVDNLYHSARRVACHKPPRNSILYFFRQIPRQININFLFTRTINS